jgi:flagellar basal-body rod protein FlgB
MTSKLDEALGTQSAALALRVQRQQQIAANIANADTPGYRAADMDFPRAMRSALGQPAAGAAAPLARTAPGHQAAVLPTSAFAGTSTMRPTTPAQPAADRNTVDMDVERARFAENAVRYEAALKALNGQIKTLLSAIQS